jgi:hypothetical protein
MQLCPTFPVRAHNRRPSLVPAFTTAILLLIALVVTSWAASADAKRRGKPVDTTISSGPAQGSTISTATPTFTFTSSIVGSTFECRLDAGAFSGCPSPFTSPALADGTHTFSVRAIDPFGNVDGSPASRGFTVSTATPPPPPDSGSIPASWTRFTSFETDLNSGTDYGWRTDSPFSVTRTDEAGGTSGSYAAKIVTNGGNTSCSCPRMTYDGLSFGAGADVWIGGSWRVADSSKLAWSRLMNLGHYEGSADPDNWYLGLMVRNSGMEVVARRFDTDSGSSVLMQPRAIPQGRWFDVDIHLRLSPYDGQALTEVYVDGARVSTSTARNMLAGGPLHFYNAGLPYYWDGNGSNTVYFDAPRIKG